ncbi:PqqD family protein [Ornithinimicrobium sp. INDO-MA30-4]|uniref:PqqD family protein n=1 Tax=Ornithinimicrobium sp. INDO-MA30-4 TaxID=2908651 RepID=UPI001F352270|nr:PqqD family protein [Ornithinimicrobium sp. INDO-MA30-4]UJH69874.1 PqqD family protein [Ornithinimicrobium sp. INDO-MA30-4]
MSFVHKGDNVVEIERQGARGELLFYVAVLPDGPLVVLEDASAMIWLRLSEAPSEDDLVAAIAEDFELAPEDVAEGVHAALASFSEIGLIQLD